MNGKTSISGNIVDLKAQRIYSGILHLNGKQIEQITETPDVERQNFIVPGFVDAHVHVESSMLTPREFGRIAVAHGTVATVSDPHEIANVLGMEGVLYMLENAKESPLKFCFGAPSCVPATPFETAGAALTADEIEVLFRDYGIRYLSEMMNFPGVLRQMPDVMEKIALAQKYGRPVDGHAPGLRGEDARQYIAAGISTDHECFTLPEALDKLRHGMKILIREGSAAKNFDALIPLLETDRFAGQIMFCSDDKHPNDLLEGHMDQLLRRAVALGVPPMRVLRCACLNPVSHYGLEVGLLQAGDPADFVVLNNLREFEVLQTYIDGELVAESGQPKQTYRSAPTPNHFHCTPKTPDAFEVAAKGSHIRVMEALDGQLITNHLTLPAPNGSGFVTAQPQNDLLKIAVVNRYEKDAPPAVGFIKNFGLRDGAIASSVAHDSHNIIAVGANDNDLCQAVNLIADAKGGLALACQAKGIEKLLALPLAGIMTNQRAEEVAAAYGELDCLAKDLLGATLTAPYMTLSFMGLSVIPHLKLSDLGLFDVDRFGFAGLFAEGG